MIPTKEVMPYVPLTVNEILRDVHHAYELGINKVHIYVRDEIKGVTSLMLA